ncbi:MAG: 5-carboxymethyl-2-hydroxymuconate semialdehyde dehydrogenase, partial [Oceanospirillum sp.]|nr:5-carboxymethyl-2-hydroxymuconate semialdehyde dehydrogenase [Oceanospirillum sp.]
TSSSRLLVQRSIYEEFIERVGARMDTMQIGHPLDPDTEVGPLVHTGHYDKVTSYFEIAKTDGATVAVGGKSLRDEMGPGNYVTPTLFVEAKNNMRIAQEEIFGPVLTAIEFDTEEEAVQLANDTIYGLAGYIWTANTGRAMRMADKVEAGMLWVNSENNRNLPSPFGGMKMSGIGRDGGDWSFDFYMETKNVCIAHDTHRVPVLGR